MKKTTSVSSDSWAQIQDLRPGLRVVLGAALSAIIATYAVLLVVAMFGIWRNNLLHVVDNLIIAAFLSSANLLGYRLKRIALANLILAMIYFLYSGVMFVSLFELSDFHLLWPIAVCLIGLPSLNAILFTKWVKAAGLSQE